METEIYDPTLLLRADIAQIALRELFEYFKGRKNTTLIRISYAIFLTLIGIAVIYLIYQYTGLFKNKK